MRKRKLENGLIYYECLAFETKLLGGKGICDECNKMALNGYLVPVLGDYMCPRCFSEWSKTAKRYPEDDAYERRKAEYWEKIIKTEEANL